VAISKERIGALFVARPDVAIAMSQPAVNKLENAVKPGGTLVVNASVAASAANRKDARVLLVPVNDLAAEVGNALTGNVIVLGALMANYHPVTVAGVKATMTGMLHNNEKLLRVNLAAFDAGYAWALRN
jgi:2-oxoglutarate ferredoxin oxidoreductase subunit gamma